MAFITRPSPVSVQETTQRPHVHAPFLLGNWMRTCTSELRQEALRARPKNDVYSSPSQPRARPDSTRDSSKGALYCHGPPSSCPSSLRWPCTEWDTVSLCGVTPKQTSSTPLGKHSPRVASEEPGQEEPRKGLGRGRSGAFLPEGMRRPDGVGGRPQLTACSLHSCVHTQSLPAVSQGMIGTHPALQVFVKGEFWSFLSLPQSYCENERSPEMENSVLQAFSPDSDVSLAG